MQEELVSFETAKLAKEKGFNWEVLHYFTNEYSTRERETSNYNSRSNHWTSQPTQSLLQKWLRDIHNVDCNVLPYRTNKKCYEVYVDIAVTTWSGYKTYEEALEVGLQEALKLVNV